MILHSFFSFFLIQGNIHFLSSTLWAFLVAQLVKNPPAMQKTWVQSLGWKDSLEKGKATHSSIFGLPCGSAGKESTCNAEDLGSVPRLGRVPGGGHGHPLQYSCLENPYGFSQMIDDEIFLFFIRVVCSFAS